MKQTYTHRGTVIFCGLLSLGLLGTLVSSYEIPGTSVASNVAMIFAGGMFVICDSLKSEGNRSQSGNPHESTSPAPLTFADRVLNFGSKLSFVLFVAATLLSMREITQADNETSTYTAFGFMIMNFGLALLTTPTTPSLLSSHPSSAPPTN